MTKATIAAAEALLKDRVGYLSSSANDETRRQALHDAQVAVAAAVEALDVDRLRQVAIQAPCRCIWTGGTGKTPTRQQRCTRCTAVGDVAEWTADV